MPIQKSTSYCTALLTALVLTTLACSADPIAPTTQKDLTQSPDPTPGADLRVTDLLHFNAEDLPHKDFLLAGKKPADPHAHNVPSTSTIYYQDDFKRKGDLHGSSPDTKNTKDAKWTVLRGPGSFSTDGHALADSNQGYDLATLPVNAASGPALDGQQNFTLSATVTPDNKGCLQLSLITPKGNLADLTFGAGQATAYLQGKVVQYCCTDNTRHLIDAKDPGPFIITITYHAKSSLLTYSILGVVIASAPVTPDQIASLTSIATGNANSGPTATITNLTLGLGGSN